MSPHLTRDDVEQAQIRSRMAMIREEETARGNRTGLEVAAEGLTSGKVEMALRFAGVDPKRGLAGVPASQEGIVRAFLRTMPRVDY